jgi:hypothetical protein
MSESTVATVGTDDIAALELVEQRDGQVDVNEAQDENDELEDVVETAEVPDLTPFRAAGVAELKLGKTITPQSMYGLAKSGAIKSNYAEYQAAGGRGHGIKVIFDGTDFLRWLREAKAGKVTTSTRMTAAELADKFDV